MDVVSDAITAVRVGRPESTRVRVAGTWCTRLAAYDGAGFHVVLEGSCLLLPDDGPPVALGPGDAALLPHGTGHVLAHGPVDAGAVERAFPFERWNGEPGQAQDGAEGGSDGAVDGAVEMLCGKYRLDRTHGHPLMTELPDVLHVPHRVGRNPELRAAIDLLGQEVGADRPGSGIALPGLIDLLLVYLVRAWLDGEADESHAGGRWPAALRDPAVASALRAMHEHPARPWTNERLAAGAGVSRATLTRRFTALLGRPPMAYLTWWRLTRAATLLRDTEDSLNSVARQVGYSSPYALSHAFTRLFGTTPGRYRRAADQAAAGAEGSVRASG
ncbi:MULTISPECIES: AraC family transcriptional regulator [Streptomyces]|uniref:AraC family transcriptional regulator n=1 Tax=Streptomyces solicathayae TaxID=3081768 RepID=A0ABZ0M4B7_9ACTN|nr:AraC family transcriptional regulator [Streptomyces sp. HUAS YS2]WOX26330.1 AraC family transcriptional regulator [Streptomyces sp. HUAS YS2]